MAEKVDRSETINADLERTYEGLSSGEVSALIAHHEAMRERVRGDVDAVASHNRSIEALKNSRKPK